MIMQPDAKVTPILYVGCPKHEREEAGRLLAAAALEVVWADTTSTALSKLQQRDMPVLLDLACGISALRTARRLRTVRARTLIFAVVDVKRPDLTAEAVVSGFADVFARPLGPSRVVNALEREGAQQGERRLPPQADVWDDLYSLSPSMRDVTSRIAHAGTQRAGVMVRGEIGTGRRVVARAIHAHQPRPARFAAVDCAAFEPEALERELFGSVGDLDRVTRTCRLYEAVGGTVYLHNVIAASARIQARLARVPHVMDVRLVAGVDPDFDRAVREGRVRDDLFQRVSAVRIDVPPLRNRREDIPALANYFLRAICAGSKVSPKTLTRSALTLIGALPWRGNAPELREVLATAAASCDQSAVSLEAVLKNLRIDGGSAVPVARGTLRQAHAHFERDYIATVMEQQRGNVSAAAVALGIERTNLYRKLRRLRVDGDVVSGVRKYQSRHIA
jgi:DNA-binding NtrC family response regulator